VHTLAVPPFDANDKTHGKLAELSDEAHRRVKRSEPIEDIGKKVNHTVRTLWNIAS
jgi:hypothetical protein